MLSQLQLHKQLSRVTLMYHAFHKSVSENAVNALTKFFPSLVEFNQ